MSFRFPFLNSEQNEKGILQNITNGGSDFSLINIRYSSIIRDPSHVDLYAPFNILDSLFFATRTNCQNNSNFYSIEIKNKLVYIEGYSIISHNYYHLRDWKLEGSLNGVEWSLLHSQQGSDELKGFNRCVYPVEKGMYSFFKITQTGDAYGDEDKSYRCRLRVKFFEIYGTITPKYLFPVNEKVNSYSFSKMCYIYILLIIE